jgi:hypothetical protein
MLCRIILHTVAVFAMTRVARNDMVQQKVTHTRSNSRSVANASSRRSVTYNNVNLVNVALLSQRATST